jgi:alpha-glucosidase
VVRAPALHRVGPDHRGGERLTGSRAVRPHHDGSELYVSNPYPELGESVTLFVRGPTGEGPSRLLVRSTPDDEIHFAEAKVDRSDEVETWWSADIEAANPVTHYRFLLEGPRRYQWLTGVGTFDWDVPDLYDFRLVTFDRPPSWGPDAVFYQIFPDRFASSGADRAWPSWAQRSAWDDPLVLGGPKAMTQLFGGDLPGIVAHLDHLERLGVTAVFLNPFFPAASNHRYNASGFDHVDPVLGGDEALAELSAELHRRHMRLIGDLTLNHCGSTHPWFQKAKEDPSSIEATFFYPGQRTDFVYWFGVPTLPKFDHRSEELRRRLYQGPDSVVAKWLRPPFDLDGWRIDVANMAGRYRDVDLNHLLATETRRTMASTKPDTYLVAEHGHDPSSVLGGDGWHGTMSYAGFARPLWEWLGDHEGRREFDFLGMPIPLPDMPGTAVAETIDAFRAAIPWRSWVHNMTLLGSHDTARWRTVAGGRDRALVGLGILLTFPGIPSIYYGDEVGMEGANGEDARRPMPWDEGRWDRGALDASRGLIALRRAHPALRRGGFRWVHAGDDVLVYLRESAEERVLVQASRRGHGPVRVPEPLVPNGGEHLLGGPALRVAGGAAELPGDGPAFHAWNL